MDNLKEIQDLWQGHKTQINQEAEAGRISDSVLAKIRNTEKNIFRKNIFKTITVFVLFIWIIWTLKQIPLITMITWIGIGLVLLSVVTMIIVYWKIQFKSSNLKYSLPQNEFIDDTIHQMREQKKKFIKLFIPFVLMMIIGMNIFYWDLLKETELTTRLIFHAGISLFLLVIGFLGIKFRERKFNKEFKPLIDELESIKS